MHPRQKRLLPPCLLEAEAISEVRAFQVEPLIPGPADPLAWWKAGWMAYERRAGVMKMRLCIVATSVPSGRVFSKADLIISERRNRISPAKVRELIFLNTNHQQQKK